MTRNTIFALVLASLSSTAAAQADSPSAAQAPCYHIAASESVAPSGVVFRIFGMTFTLFAAPRAAECETASAPEQANTIQRDEGVRALARTAPPVRSRVAVPAPHVGAAGIELRNGGRVVLLGEPSKPTQLSVDGNSTIVLNSQ